MRLILTNVITAFLLVAFINVGCGRGSAPLSPLPEEQIPSALQEAFVKAQPEVKDLANQVVAALQTKDYSKAFLVLQILGGHSGLNKQQQNVASRSILTVNGLLQAAQEKGDFQAAETLNTYRANK